MPLLSASRAEQRASAPIGSAQPLPAPGYDPPAPEPGLEPSEVIPLEGDAEIGALRQEWLDLAAALPASSYFQTPDWVLAWWKTVAAKPATRLGVWRGPTGALEAIAAISRVAQPLRPRSRLTVPTWIAAGSGVGAADHCGWVARPHCRPSVQRWMLGHRARGTLLFENLDPDVGLEPTPDAWPVQHIRCPRLLVSLDEREMGWSSNLRQQLRARERKLRAAGVDLAWIDPPDVDQGLLDSLFALHQARWSGRHQRSNFTQNQTPLHRQLIETAAQGRGPGAVVATHHGRRIGVLYGFWWQHVFAYYQMGWDPAYAEYSLGTLLLREGIKMTAGRGGRVFDFLRGTEPVKYRFQARDRIDTTWLFPRGASGALLALSFTGRTFARTVRRRWAATWRIDQNDA